MSTTIKEITGRFEAKHYANFTVDYKPSNISVTRFYGGKENGAMIQITIYNENGSGYVQLTKDRVMELAETLKDSYNYDKYPSE